MAEEFSSDINPLDKYFSIEVFSQQRFPGEAFFLLLVKVQLEFSTVSECVPLTERCAYRYRQGIRRNADMAAAVPRMPGTITSECSPYITGENT